MTSELKQEYTRRISQANSTDMVVVIYDITLSYIGEAIECINQKDETGLRQNIVKIRKCLNELIGSLNYEYPLAGELLKLYIYCSSRLIDLGRQTDISIAEELKSILERLREAYAQIANTNQAGPVMSNSQSVYAGLTYGRGSLNEEVLIDRNRGFLA